MTFQLTEPWKEAIRVLLKEGGTVLALGATDTGKSTFCLALANACAAQGRSCSVVDADTGQSEIGPPATVGAAHVKGPVVSFSHLDPEGLYFTGSTSPAGHLLQTVTGAVRMHQCVRKSDPHLTIVDMPGLVTGAVGRVLVENTAGALQPDWLVALHRGDELEPALAPLSRRKHPQILRLAPAQEARRRSPEERATRRRLKFAAYFEKANELTVDPREAPMSGLGLFSGRDLAPNLRAYLQREWKTDIIHAETLADRVIVITSRAVNAYNRRKVSGEFRGQTLTVATAFSLQNLLVGLIGEDGAHLAIGVLQNIDFGKQEYSIVAPLRTPASIRQIIAGSVRVSPQGHEITGEDQQALDLPQSGPPRRR